MNLFPCSACLGGEADQYVNYLHFNPLKFDSMKINKTGAPEEKNWPPNTSKAYSSPAELYHSIAPSGRNTSDNKPSEPSILNNFVSSNRSTLAFYNKSTSTPINHYGVLTPSISQKFAPSSQNTSGNKAETTDTWAGAGMKASR